MGRSPTVLMMNCWLRSTLDHLHPDYAFAAAKDSTKQPRVFSLEDLVYARNYAEGALRVPGWWCRFWDL